MRLPRDISADTLIERLKLFGYEESRQKGSHIRLTTQQHGEHHLTIARHDPVKIGALARAINEVAGHFEISREDVIRRLFEQ